MKFFREAVDTAKLLASNDDVLKHEVVGSACYREDAKDLDILVLIKPVEFQSITQATHEIFGGAWSLCGEDYEDMDEHWCARRKGDVNLIITDDPGWFDRAVVANAVCIGLQLEDKHSRKVVYRIVRDGQDPNIARNTP